MSLGLPIRCNPEGHPVVLLCVKKSDNARLLWRRRACAYSSKALGRRLRGNWVQQQLIRTQSPSGPAPMTLQDGGLESSGSEFCSSCRSLPDFSKYTAALRVTQSLRMLYPSRKRVSVPFRLAECLCVVTWWSCVPRFEYLAKRYSQLKPTRANFSTWMELGIV